MTITVVSKHLPLAGRFFHTPAGPRVLSLLHLVESTRYHFNRFQVLTLGKEHTPKGFKPGIEVSGAELNHYWCFMGAFIELEGYLLAVKRFLDHSWCCIGEPFGNGAEKIRTLPEALFKMHKKVKNESHRKMIKQHPYFQELKLAWDNWGAEISSVRNYVEHVAPLGGMTDSYGISLTQAGQVLDPFLPDELPHHRNNNIPKEKLTYKNKRSATEYIQWRMADVDNLISALLSVDEPLLFDRHNLVIAP